MKITKFVHSCLLVETPDRVTLFDPGMMSESSLDVDKLERLDDIIITHIHPDHLSTSFIKKLVAKFPQVRITATAESVEQLKSEGITARSEPSNGIVFFDAPHENVGPVYPQPQEIGVHYLDMLTDPGDSHSFTETKAILALPVTAPWGAMIPAIRLALELKPLHILPVHDWHWNDAAREDSYNNMEALFAKQGITFHKLQTGVSVEINL